MCRILPPLIFPSDWDFNNGLNAKEWKVISTAFRKLPSKRSELQRRMTLRGLCHAAFWIHEIRSMHEIKNITKLYDLNEKVLQHNQTQGETIYCGKVLVQLYWWPTRHVLAGTESEKQIRRYDLRRAQVASQIVKFIQQNANPQHHQTNANT